MQTRAAVLYPCKEPLEIEDLELAQPLGEEVLVRMVSSGVCHTDASVIHGGFPNVPLPVVLGHEGAGVVEAVGSAVTRVWPGDTVVLAAEPYCGQCKACLQGKPFHCVMHTPWAFGGRMPDGTKRFKKGEQEIGHFFCQSSFSQYSVAPQRIAIKMPAELSLEKLAPLCCGVQTGAGAVLNTAQVRMGESVAVFGCGGVGLSAVMAARLARAFPIIAVDLLPDRLELACELGATHALNPGEGNAVEEIRSITGGGADYAFECVGTAATIRQCVDSIRSKGGTAVLTGAPPFGSETTLDALSLIAKNILGNIQGSSIPDIFIPALVKLWRQGEFPFDRLSPRTYSPGQINQAIADMMNGQVIKPIIRYADKFAP